MKRPIQIKAFQFSDQWIVYQDQDLVIANKPSGLLSVPGKTHTECLVSLLAEVIDTPLIVHRLDMDTSGLMVLAKNKKTQKLLSMQFQERQVRKSYIALCAGKAFRESGKTCLPMRCDWENRPLQMVDFLHGKHADTHWKVIQQFFDSFLIQLTPITGRSHQLRLHCKLLGHPILGDNLYADDHSLVQAKRLCLHAESLSFEHPTSEEWLTFTQPIDFLEYKTN